jgi:hypothetical protein
VRPYFFPGVLVILVLTMVGPPALARDDARAIKQADASATAAGKIAIDDTSTDAGAGQAVVGNTAAGEPRRLSDLAGDDERAWQSAHSVHPRLFRKKPR